MPELVQQLDAPAGVFESFEHEARHIIEHLRVAIADIVAACPQQIERPAALTRWLSIDKSLAWKLMRSIQSADAFTAAQTLPGPSGIEIFLNAAEKQGVSDTIVKRATERLGHYEAFIRRHGGDRRTFLRILGSLAPDEPGGGGGAAAVEASHRKAAFEANSFIWGVKVRTHVGIHIVRPSDDGDSVNIAAIVALVDLVRLRPDTPWVISRTAYVSDKGVIQPALAREPIDPAASAHDAPLMTEFCSQPLPVVKRHPVAGNFLETTLMAGPVGETAANTVTTGELYRKVAPRYRQEGDDDAKFYMRLRTPAEHMVNIMLVQRGEFAEQPPSIGIYSELDSVLHHPVDLTTLRPLTNDTLIQNLGSAAGPIVWPREAPQLGDLIKRACEHLDWPLGDFDVYQARQSHPILRSVAIIAFPMRPA